MRLPTQALMTEVVTRDGFQIEERTVAAQNKLCVINRGA